MGLQFDGSKISGGGINGLYFLKDFTISGGGNTLTVLEQIPTAAYHFTDFEGLVTTISFDPLPNQTGWNKTNLTATLVTTDPSGGPGVKEIHSRVNFQDEVVAPGTPTTVVLTQEGISTLSYFAVDNNGLREPTKSFRIGIDKTPPVITTPEIPFPVLIGSQFPFSFRVADSLSGVKTTLGVFNGTLIEGRTPILFTRLEDHNLTVTATDVADNIIDLNKSFFVCNAEGFINTDGDRLVNCVDPDDDNDGVLDINDECPFLSTPNVVEGTSGDDKLYGTSGSDLIRGFSGNDKIHGHGGNDCLVGGDGADTLYDRDGKSILLGGEGNDKLHGGKGSDVLDGGAGEDTLYGNEGNDTLLGGEGKDKLHGSTGDDVLDSGAGEDRLYGNEGNDTLLGGDGEDRLYGSEGNDILRGGTGDDQLYGDSGSDALDGGEEIDRCYGGSGTDTAVHCEAVRNIP